MSEKYEEPTTLIRVVYREAPKTEALLHMLDAIRLEIRASAASLAHDIPLALEISFDAQGQADLAFMTLRGETATEPLTTPTSASTAGASDGR